MGLDDTMRHGNTRRSIWYDTIRWDASDQIKSSPVEITYDSIVFDCCCTFLYSLKCKIILLGIFLIVMLYCVFQIEHHPMFCTENCMYYIIYLRQIVDRVYFYEDIVVLQPWDCGKNEIIPVYFLFSRSSWICAKYSIIIMMIGYYNIRPISISSTLLNR